MADPGSGDSGSPDLGSDLGSDLWPDPGPLDLGSLDPDPLDLGSLDPDPLDLGSLDPDVVDALEADLVGSALEELLPLLTDDEIVELTLFLDATNLAEDDPVAYVMALLRDAHVPRVPTFADALGAAAGIPGDAARVAAEVQAILATRAGWRVARELAYRANPRGEAWVRDRVLRGLPGDVAHEVLGMLRPHPTRSSSRSSGGVSGST